MLVDIKIVELDKELFIKCYEHFTTNPEDNEKLLRQHFNINNHYEVINLKHFNRYKLDINNTKKLKKVCDNFICLYKENNKLMHITIANRDNKKYSKLHDYQRLWNDYKMTIMEDRQVNRLIIKGIDVDSLDKIQLVLIEKNTNRSGIKDSKYLVNQFIFNIYAKLYQKYMAGELDIMDDDVSVRTKYRIICLMKNSCKKTYPEFHYWYENNQEYVKNITKLANNKNHIKHNVNYDFLYGKAA